MFFGHLYIFFGNVNSDLLPIEIFLKHFIYLASYFWLGFPGGLYGNAVDLGWITGLGRSPGERNGNPLQYSCLENPHGQRSLVGYSPWGRKE